MNAIEKIDALTLALRRLLRHLAHEATCESLLPDAHGNVEPCSCFQSKVRAALDGDSTRRLSDEERGLR